MEFDGKKVEELYDRVLVSVGRAANSADLGLENTGVKLDEKGFIKVNSRQQTERSRTSTPSATSREAVLLAHKAHKEGRIAVEVINGQSVHVRRTS